ncbi:B-box-type zinc finger [Parasponia andersonii]|uniref:B-box-type zinc finger n=1 Tax=Parasponia andersonii TaxID=3476 RepID=A0A2P5BYK1_PARAD|nr:B-box-type zinc finger [Parasponia andersonii]
MVGVVSIPQWLEFLLGEKFFTPCNVHECTKKNEKNIFCLDCCTSICSHCLPSHHLHSLLQIRRYVYHDVIRLSDAQKLIDCSSVQSYTINSAKVVFLNPRPLSRPFRASGNFCIKCDRSLQDPFLFCSLSCKVHHLMVLKKGTKERRKLVHGCGFLKLPNRAYRQSFPELEVDRIRMTPKSVLDPPVLLSGSTLSTTSSGEGVVSSGESWKSVVLVKKKRSSVNYGPHVMYRPARCLPAADVAVGGNRRKGVPQRSPLY